MFRPFFQFGYPIGISDKNFRAGIRMPLMAMLGDCREMKTLFSGFLR
jgi:hypothetical protein